METIDDLKARLHHAQKMDAVGRLAAGAAHEFNNLLTIILASCEEGLSAPDVPSSARDSFDTIRLAAKSAASLAAQLLDLSRRESVQRRVLNVNDVLADAQRLVVRLIKADIDLQVHRDPRLGDIVADAVQLQQVLVNLVANARDAMPHGGRIVIETRSVDVPHGDVAAHSRLPPGRYAQLAVSDTGVGMDDATRARIFEPFFTTKPAAQGTGLGLSTVHGIVTESGGFIWACSKPGIGSTFTICFPLVD
ncbi:MAG TPA: ATP-binding protein [Vicinamibacterales bacterium]|jgi:signal transduction histidine kinase